MERIFKIAGYDISPGHEKWDSGLAYCHKNNVRPLCMCVVDGVEMYVAKTKNSFCIKRMPKKGGEHAITCPSYEAPRELSGRGYVDDAAISEDEETGETSLKVDFPLSKNKNAKAPEAPDGSVKDTVEAVQKKLTLRALFDYLYDEAGLNRWDDSISRRSWKQVREALMLALSNKRAKSFSLDQRVLIPETFFLEKKDVHYQRIRKFIAQLNPDKNTRPVGVLFGEFKAIEEARFGFKLLIKHMPGNPLFFDEKMHQKILKAFAYELSVFAESDDVHLLVATTFYVTESGNLQMDLCSLIPTNEYWIPFYNNDEKILIDTLIGNKTQFTKSLRYNVPMNEVIASALIPHQEALKAVYVMPIGATDEYNDKLDQVIEETENEAIIIDFNDDNVIDKIALLTQNRLAIPHLSDS